MSISNYKPQITIFTPTYNRGYIIKNLYESLQKQTIKDFEWLVVDDGSTDNTMELFQNWTELSNEFKIKYAKVENGGKHRAINTGLDMAEGELFFIVDSDDFLVDNAIEIIIKWYKSIENSNSKFCGVAGLKGYNENDIVGNTFKGDYIDATSLERSKLKIKGDKAEVFKTNVLRKYNFPELPGEKFMSENIVWYRIANDGYKFRWFNEIIYICNYLEDGLTKNIDNIYINNFEGYTQQIKECLKYFKDGKLERKYLFRIITAYIYRARKKKLSVKVINSKIKISCFYIIILIVVGKVYKVVKK